MRGAVLLLAAGEGRRLAATSTASRPKVFVDLDGKPLLRYSLDAIAEAELVDELVIAAPEGSESMLASLVGSFPKPVRFVLGGESRQASAFAALREAGDSDAVLVHDAARPLAPASLFDACLRELDSCLAVCPAIPVTDTIKRTEGDHIVETIDRSRLAAAQTPQGFRSDVYRRAHEEASSAGYVGTDDASLMERMGIEVKLIPGDDRNMKITTRHDLDVATMLLKVPR